MSIDIKSMNLQELKQLQKEVNHAVDTYKVRQREEAIRDLENLAREKGFSLAELTEGLKSRRKPVAPKYAHPENPEMTWTGRGRQPKWVVQAMKDGKSLDDLLIDK